MVQYDKTIEVVVGNVGVIYRGHDEGEAINAFNDYVRQSRHGIGRAAGEPVAYLVNGEPDPEREHYGAGEDGDDIEESPMLVSGHNVYAIKVITRDGREQRLTLHTHAPFSALSELSEELEKLARARALTGHAPGTHYEIRVESSTRALAGNLSAEGVEAWWRDHAERYRWVSVRGTTIIVCPILVEHASSPR